MGMTFNYCNHHHRALSSLTPKDACTATRKLNMWVPSLSYEGLGTRLVDPMCRMWATLLGRTCVSSIEVTRPRLVFLSPQAKKYSEWQFGTCKDSSLLCRQNRLPIPPRPSRYLNFSSAHRRCTIGVLLVDVGARSPLAACTFQ